MIGTKKTNSVNSVRGGLGSTTKVCMRVKKLILTPSLKRKKCIKTADILVLRSNENYKPNMNYVCLKTPLFDDFQE